MITLTSTQELAAFCARAHESPYITVDTEFLRERTYFAQLCLVQLALPGDAPENAVLVDVIAGDIDLAPLYEVFRDESVVKVLHAARQDLEIFYIDGGVLPTPLFDTQVAAMVCGHGDQVGYETLVRKIAKAKVDKSSRFTDWSRRPLSEAQKAYALADVTHLRAVYEHLDRELRRAGRSSWVEEELAVLGRPETYLTDPAEAWRRLRTRSASGRFLAVVRELARFREEHAQKSDIPRNRVFKDEALLEIASTRPQTPEELSRLRLLLREARRGDIAEGILQAVKAGLACPPSDFPEAEPEQGVAINGNKALADLLRVLLKARSESSGVAQKLIASAGDLDEIASGNEAIPALSGWRREVFGEDALRLCRGEIALAAEHGTVRVVDLSASGNRPSP